MTEPGSSADGGPRPSVAAPFVPVLLDADTVQFRCGPWAGPAFTLRDRDAEGKVAELVELLDGRRTRDAVLEAFGPADREDVAEILDELADNGVVIDAAERASDRRAGGYVAADRTFTANDDETLAASAVVVVNVGRIGRFVLEDLVDLGAENVTLFEPEGTHDIPPFDGEEDGAVSRIDTDLATAVGDADVLVFTVDSPRPELAAAVNETTFEADVPWISGQLWGLDGFVGPAVIPRRTCCYACFRTRVLGNVDDLHAYRGFERSARAGDGDHALAAPARVVAGYVTIDLLHLLLDGIGFTAGSVVHFDFFDLTVESNSVLKLPRCRVCGRSGRDTLDRQRHVDLDGLLEE